MNHLSAALAACFALCMSAANAHASDLLTLDAAINRVVRSHPELRVFAARAEVLAAERDEATQRPAPELELGLENVLGSGEYHRFAGAELSLNLASTLERGSKLDARRTLAQARIDAQAPEREIQRLDLLAETARRYLAVVAARAQVTIGLDDIAQHAHALEAARQRQRAGAETEAVVLFAQAAHARAELEHDRAQLTQAAALRHLAALWGERAPQFELADVDPTQLPQIDSLDALLALLDATPELAIFASERRVREAQLRLAQAGSTPDLGWSLGVRRLQGDRDTALIGGLSLPLGTSSQSQAAITGARAELAALEIEREAASLALHSTLIEAHGRYLLAQTEVERLEQEILPALAKAERATERAFRSGAADYHDWATAQSERTDARRQQLQAAVEAQGALIEIQRLTGQPFITRTATGDQP